MILPNMTPAEILRQVDCDRKEADKWLERYAPHILRDVRRCKRWPFMRRMPTFTSERHNTVIWLTFVISHAMERKGVVGVFTASVANDRHGLTAYTITSSTQWGVALSEYDTHFYKRFAERCGLAETGLDLISRYHLRNSSSMVSVRDDEIGAGTYAFSCVDDGVALGNVFKEDGVVFFRWNTFVTYDMLRRTQANLAEKLVESRKAHEEARAAGNRLAAWHKARCKAIDDSYAGVERTMWRIFDKLQKLK